jgi:hypothetical protein
MDTENPPRWTPGTRADGRATRDGTGSQKRAPSAGWLELGGLMTRVQRALSLPSRSRRASAVALYRALLSPPPLPSILGAPGRLYVAGYGGEQAPSPGSPPSRSRLPPRLRPPTPRAPPRVVVEVASIAAPPAPHRRRYVRSRAGIACAVCIACRPSALEHFEPPGQFAWMLISSGRRNLLRWVCSANWRLTH